ncbi:hypothetical protein ATO5_00805 [Loktanella sp. 22II-4b]|nr:hypothetical protein ATO5_00805 [Loktanella sp. 22II-4b]
MRTKLIFGTTFVGAMFFVLIRKVKRTNSWQPRFGVWERLCPLSLRLLATVGCLKIPTLSGVRWWKTKEMGACHGRSETHLSKSAAETPSMKSGSNWEIKRFFRLRLA